MEKENKNLSINISAGSIMKTILVILLFVFLFYIKDLVLVVLTAVVIASGIEPLINWFKKYKISRLPGVIITYVLLFVVFTGLFYFFVPSVLNEASIFLSSVPKYLDSATLWDPLSVNKDQVTISQKVVQSAADGINNPVQLAKDISQSQLKITAATPSNFGLKDLVSSMQDISSNMSEGFIKIASAVFGGLLSFTLIIVISFYLAVQEDGVGKFLGLISPVKHEKYIVDLWKRSQRKIGYWMQGQLLLGIIIGVLVYLGLMILGIKNALLLAVLAGVLEIIPLFGPVMAAIPAILSALVDGGITSGFLVLGLYIIVQQFENHLIYPLVVRKIIGVSPILIILAIIIGAKLAGFLGVVLSVPIVSAIMELFEDIEKRKHLFWEKVKEADPVV